MAASPYARQAPLVLCSPPLDLGRPLPVTGASSWAIYDTSSETFLAEHNPHARRFPASLTKMATAVIALEEADLDRGAVVDIDYRNHRRSSDLGLRPGMQTTLKDLFIGMLTVSGNDAATELAAEVSGSEEQFVTEMNELARRLGLQNTGFANSHGRDREGHYSTAHDMALVAAKAMRYEFFRQVVRAPSATITIDGSPWNLRNTNRFLAGYDGATGVKTGFTVLGGPSLAAAAQRDGRELVVVLLNDRARFEDAAKLLDWAFTNHLWDC